MHDLHGRHPKCGIHVSLRSRFRTVQLAIVMAALLAGTARAQDQAGLEFRLGIGTFLSHDRGWNYSEPVELFATVVAPVGSVDVEAGASFFKSFAQFVRPAEVPRLPGSYREGFGARLGVRVPSAARGALSALIGAELIHSRTDGSARGTTIAGAAGIGLNFGSERRGSIELRYVRFAERLGSSRGILPLTIAWRL